MLTVPVFVMFAIKGWLNDHLPAAGPAESYNAFVNGFVTVGDALIVTGKGTVTATDEPLVVELTE